MSPSACSLCPRVCSDRVVSPTLGPSLHTSLFLLYFSEPLLPCPVTPYLKATRPPPLPRRLTGRRRLSRSSEPPAFPGRVPPLVSEQYSRGRHPRLRLQKQRCVPGGICCRWKRKRMQAGRGPEAGSAGLAGRAAGPKPGPRASSGHLETGLEDSRHQTAGSASLS